MSEHMKEPWEVGRDPASVYGKLHGKRIMIADLRFKDGPMRINAENNARRIVACVNACRETSNEALEDDTVIKMREDRDQLLVSLNKAEALADKLGEALESLVSAIRAKSQAETSYPVSTLYNFEYVSKALTEWRESKK